MFTRQETASSITPGGIRTPNLWLRRPLLYPVELQARWWAMLSSPWLRVSQRVHASFYRAACPQQADQTVSLPHKLRDSTFRSNSPAFTGWSEADAVVILSVKEVPSGAVVERNIGARRPHRNPTIFRPADSRAKGKPLVEQIPSLAAVGRDGRGCTAVMGFAIIAADDDAVMRIAEGNRENASGFEPSHDRRFANLPILTPVLGMKYARRFCSARRKPDVGFAVSNQAGAAGSEGALAGQSRRQNLCRQRFPIVSTVDGDNQLKQPFFRVAEADAVLLVPEGEGIKKAAGSVFLNCSAHDLPPSTVL
jgi:hypothetical protein